MAEFEIAGRSYRSGKLSAMDAFHVLRRLSPVLGSFRDIQNAASGGQGADLLAAMEPIAMAIAKMPDADCDYILHACLKTVRRKDDGDRGWPVIWNAEARRPQYEDEFTLPLMLQIVVQVLQDNFSDFFSAALPT